MLIRTSGSNTPGSAASADKYSGLAISGFLGELTLQTVRERRIRFLFASGGDTAARIAGAMQTDAIDFVAELLPGLPFGSFRSAALGRKLYFVTKSGGFGGPDAMADALALVSPESVPRKEFSE